MSKSKSLSPKMLKEIMKALGFHHLDSRARWKFKWTDTIMVTDADLRWANSSGDLPVYLIGKINESIEKKESLLLKKKILLSLMKD